MHLLNAHALKRSYPHGAARRAKRTAVRHVGVAQDPDSDEEEEEGGEEEDPIPLNVREFITNQWTSWPLSASVVPRDEEHRRPKLKGWTDETVTRETREEEQTPAGEVLREVVMAVLVRRANERVRGEGRAGLKPSVDDAESGRVLGPVVASVVASVDELLMGLNSEREHYVKGLVPEEAGGSGRHKWEAPREGSDREEEEEQETVGKKKKRKRAAPEEYAKYLRNRRYRLRLRDWSQVVGVAAIRGWEKETVSRAARACARLFGEDMGFRSMPKKGTGEVWHAKDGAPTREAKKAQSKRKRKRKTADGFLEVVKVSWGSNLRKARVSRVLLDRKKESGTWKRKEMGWKGNKIVEFRAKREVASDGDEEMYQDGDKETEEIGRAHV